MFVILSFFIDDKQSASDLTELYADAIGLDGKVHRFHLDSCETNNALEALPFFLPPPARRRSDTEEVVLVPGSGDASTPLLSPRNDSFVEEHRAAGETAVLLPAPPPANSSRRSDTEEGDIIGNVIDITSEANTPNYSSLGGISTSQRFLQSLSVFDYPLEMSENVKCIICRNAVEKHDPMYALPCAHIVHVTCLRTWFRYKTTATCPECNRVHSH